MKKRPRGGRDSQPRPGGGHPTAKRPQRQRGPCLSGPQRASILSHSDLSVEQQMETRDRPQAAPPPLASACRNVCVLRSSRQRLLAGFSQSMPRFELGFAGGRPHRDPQEVVGGLGPPRAGAHPPVAAVSAPAELQAGDGVRLSAGGTSDPPDEGTVAQAAVHWGDLGCPPSGWEGAAALSRHVCPVQVMGTSSGHPREEGRRWASALAAKSAHKRAARPCGSWPGGQWAGQSTRQL